MIYLGADHRGYELKNKLFQRLQDDGLEVVDLGNDKLDPEDDYPDFAQKVGEAVSSDPKNRGILLCGSGVGVDIAANKVDGVRSALVETPQKAISARNDDNINVISLSADDLDEQSAYEIVKAFLSTNYQDEERFERRLDKIEEIEEKK